MIQTIKQEYQKLPEREQKAIYWGLHLVGAELSKILILLFFFTIFSKVPEFVFTAATLLPVRTKMGGIHFKTYLGCLSVSIALFAGAVMLLPTVLPLTQKAALLLLIVCMIVNIFTRPVINPTRPALTEEDIIKTRWRIGLFFTVYIIAAYIFYNHYFLCGTWMIVEQTVQLLIGRILEFKKGGVLK